MDGRMDGSLTAPILTAPAVLISFFFFWTDLSPHTDDRCLIAYWLGFRKVENWQAYQVFKVHPSSLALIRRQFVQVVSDVPSRLSQEVVIAEEVVMVVCHLVLVLHKPLLVPLLHGPKEVSPRLTSLTPLLSSWSMEL